MFGWVWISIILIQEVPSRVPISMDKYYLFFLFINNIKGALPLCNFFVFDDEVKLFIEINSEIFQLEERLE